MHPVTYSLILNILALLLSGGLALAFNAPWMVIIAIALQTHAIQRFEKDNRGNDDKDDDPAIGFLADVKR